MSKKRPYSSGGLPADKNDGGDDDDDDDDDGPLLKVTKLEPKDSSINSDESNNDDQSESCNGDMWRPW